MDDLDGRVDLVFETDLSQEQIVALYQPLGWKIRKWSWTDYEMSCEWAELYLEGDPVFLLHGPMASPLAHADELLDSLRQAKVHFWGEFHDADHNLLKEFDE